jgi:hypothetical protein
MASARRPGDSAPTTTWPPVVWAARLCVYFLAQGALVLLAYAYYGFGTNPEHFPLGFRIDPILAAINLAWGLAGTFVGFFRPRYSLIFLFAFAAFYSALALLGSFTGLHLGMMLNERINRFHWVVALAAWAISLVTLWRKRHAH